jgi:hypothetical protein
VKESDPSHVVLGESRPTYYLPRLRLGSAMLLSLGPSGASPVIKLPKQRLSRAHSPRSAHDDFTTSQTIVIRVELSTILPRHLRLQKRLAEPTKQRLDLSRLSITTWASDHECFASSTTVALPTPPQHRQTFAHLIMYAEPQYLCASFC